MNRIGWNRKSRLMLLAGILAGVFVQSAEAAKILFVRKAGRGFDEVHATMDRELSKKHELQDYLLVRSTAYDSFKEKVESVRPELVVLMDNQSVSYAIRYNSEQKDAKKKLKGVALMALNLKAILKGNSDFSGIAFEAPAYTLLTQFRYLVQKPIKNVLVLYRKSLFQDTIDAASKELATEGITLHAKDVEQQGKGKAEVDAQVEKLLKQGAFAPQTYDAIWVILDSAILNQTVFQSVWLPMARASKIPFVTGTEEFVSKEMNFATFAITPNFEDLAGQAIQQVEAILIDEVSPGDLGVEQMISVNKVLNLIRARELGLKLREDKLEDVKLLE